MRELLSVSEACKALKISRTTLYHLRRQGLIRPVRIGRRVLFDVKDLERLIENCKKKAADVA